MSTNKKIKTDNNKKIFQDIIDFEILRSIINYLLISKKNKNNNNNTNEILNYILVSKKCIINNKLFEHWLKINYNNKSFIENFNNQNQYDKNNLISKNKKYKQNKISFNKEFSIIKIKESIINDYFKFNFFLDYITIDDFKEIKNKFENNQLLYNRIVVNGSYEGEVLFGIHEYLSNENSGVILNLFKILELNHAFNLYYKPKSEEKDEEDGHDDKGNKKCTEIYLNSLSVFGFDEGEGEVQTLKIFKVFKGKNLVYDGSEEDPDFQTHINYSALFDPDSSGQQVESIQVQNKYDNEESVEARHLIKVNQFKNLHSIIIPINSFQILSNLSKEMGFISSHGYEEYSGNSENMKSELNQMINSIVTSKSLKNLKITSVNSIYYPIDYKAFYDGDLETLTNKVNETIESFSNSFKPLFSELNTSIERIEFDCMGLLNINTFSNLLNNKSIKYLYLYNSDFIVFSPKKRGGPFHREPISINQYLFDNIFSSPLTSIRHYKIKFIKSNELKFIFNLILNNIFKLQLYSLIFEFNENELIGEFFKEYKNLKNNISTQQQKSNNINLKEIKIKIKDDEYIQELNNINIPYFTTTLIKKIT
ncbi:hypothetical protein DDB_G0271202 [Dictyostelium discoideum AX4]|uniref:Uncharacterized protein n=1 Tax=Dictyostelium discoideum TaxID=44689 RepID=Q55B76_DICDI|nr:hypothetical protein DDB_G0271202 [Dictyostelium discoideum AX4]EAL71731.1 hypothetical protein DDB_G0271202 [Dictyostelium discoideum AX4]|eukprot:XP_645736.1 hypothetical protein DDB_G0271202 [Dictyostelium discoideum AX4]